MTNLNSALATLTLLFGSNYGALAMDMPGSKLALTSSSSWISDPDSNSSPDPNIGKHSNYLHLASGPDPNPAPVSSIDSSLGVRTNQAANASPNAVNNGRPAGSTSTSSSSIPTKAFGAIVGTFIGTPVCIVHRIAYNEKDGIHGMIGETDNKLARYSAGAFWLPFSMVTGTLEGPFYS